jgi:hypothetical protein
MKYILLLKCLLLYALCALSQTPISYQFTPNNGLPSNEVYHVTTDHKGYLWFGTDRGIARFDGKHFKLYTVNEGLGDNVVDKIFVSPGDKIWARCMDRKLYVLEQERFVAYKYADQLESLLGPEADYVTSIYFQQEQPLFLGTNFSGLLRVSKDSIIHIQYADTGRTLRYHAGLNIAHVHNILNLKLNACDFIFNGKLYQNKTRATLKPSALARTNGDVILCFTNWLFVIRNNTIISSIGFDMPITSVYEDKWHNLWVCFFMRGATKFAANEPITKHGGRTYFADYKITGLTQDFEGGYWFTSYNSGVFYVPDLNIESINLDGFGKYEYPRELTGNGKDKLYLVTTDKRIYMLERLTLKRLNNGDTTAELTSVCNDVSYNSKYGKIMAVYSGSVLCADETDPNFVQRIKGSKAVLAAGDSLYTLGSYSLWIYPDSVVKYSNDSFFSDDIHRIAGSDDRRVENIFYSMYVSRNPFYILVGSSRGLIQLTEKRKFIRIFESSINIRVNAIQKLQNGTLVIATLGKGIFLIKGKRVQQVVLGLAAQQNMVNDLAVHGNITWAATEKGVVRIDLSDTKHPKLKSWSAANGFPYNDVRKIYIQQGKVYVIAQNKLITIDEEALAENMAPPGVFLNSIVVNDHIGLPPDSAFDFKYQHHRIGFSFNGIAFKSGEHLRYKYRLRGFDYKWQIVTQPFVEFPSLPFGSYTFELVSLNESDIASLVPVTYSFNIPPPFWKRWWFFIAGIIAIFGIIWFMVKDRFRREQQRNMEREAMLQYEQQALSAQINPHFIFNALNSIQNFILQEDKRNAIKYLGRFSKLMRLNLDNARQKWIPPHKEFELIETYLELEKLRHKDRFTYKIHISNDPMPGQLLVPSMLIQPFVENAILHGVNNLTDTTGLVEVDLQYVNGKLICKIEDNGVGREKAEELKHVHKRTHEGSGLTITRERLHLLCNETRTDFRLDVMDKKNEAGLPSGTIVVFNLPYK